MSQSVEVKSSEVEGLFQRWSQRKQDVKQAETQELPIEQTEPEDPALVLTDEDMPPVESLSDDSDFSGFLSPNVSEELRKVALRKLFNGAVFNQRDGLDDYDDDFTSFAKLGNIVTADMKHQMEEVKKKLDAMEEEGDDKDLKSNISLQEDDRLTTEASDTETPTKTNQELADPLKQVGSDQARRDDELESEL